MRRTESLWGSAITRAAYDDETKILEVTFTSGQTYTFHEVPAEIYDGLLAAGSPGRYYHAFIKGQFA